MDVFVKTVLVVGEGWIMQLMNFWCGKVLSIKALWCQIFHISNWTSVFIMCEGILGCFQLTESDNFEEYLEALEMPLPMRKMMAMAKPKVRQTIKPKYLTLLKRLTYQMMATIGPSVTRLPTGWWWWHSPLERSLMIWSLSLRKWARWILHLKLEAAPIFPEQVTATINE